MSLVSDVISKWGRFVTFSHTIFALPFAGVALVVAAERYGVLWWQVVAILLCMVSARSAAMGFNRYMDADIDAKNPRTQMRDLPQGRISPLQARFFVVLMSALFLLGSGILGLHCLILAPAVLAVLFYYSIAKRCTPYSHLVLGLALALAPGGAWFALSHHAESTPLPLMAGVLLWVAGFDIIYSCQDEEFDRNEGLFSIPSQVGKKRALEIAKLLHGGCIALFLLFGAMYGGSFWYYLTVGSFSLFLVSQHRLVTPDDLSNVSLAFFTRNGVASVVFFVGVVVDCIWRSFWML